VSSVRDAVASRRSVSKVTDAAPTHEDLLALLGAASRVADHSALRPWRVVELRGQARERLGEALAAASGKTGDDAGKLAAKPLRAPLLLAIVACHRPSEKVPEWEQDAVAAGVAHTLSLLLNDAGWGVMWRTGAYVRSEQVARMHRLTAGEKLMGWLYVGGLPDDGRSRAPKHVDARPFLSVLE
jgi:nitroreductase